jgi:hypothetical protein
MLLRHEADHIAIHDISAVLILYFFHSPASLAFMPTSPTPLSTLVPASATPSPTLLPALPVVPETVSPSPRVAPPTVPPTVLVRPPTCGVR